MTLKQLLPLLLECQRTNALWRASRVEVSDA